MSTRCTCMHTEIPEWLTTDQVAKMLQVSVQKLKNDRVAKRGLPFTKLGGVVRYSRAEIARHLELATVHPRANAA